MNLEVADAVKLQDDMDLVGVADVVHDYRIRAAVERGYPVFAADPERRAEMETTGIPLAGTLDDLLQQVELGVFAALAQSALTAREIAERVDASERGVRLLLGALDALGYVESLDGRFAATRLTRRWLMQPSPGSLERGIPFFASMVFDRWATLAESIRRGAPLVNGYEWLDRDPQRCAAYEDAMLVMARTAAPEIVSKTKLPRTARRLLDIGGGHGTVSADTESSRGAPDGVRAESSRTIAR